MLRTADWNTISEGRSPTCEPDVCGATHTPRAGVEIPIRTGIVNMILKAFGARLYQPIEPFDQAQRVGWRPTNDVATSNHPRATVMDRNRTRTSQAISSRPFHGLIRSARLTGPTRLAQPDPAPTVRAG